MEKKGDNETTCNGALQEAIPALTVESLRLHCKREMAGIAPCPSVLHCPELQEENEQNSNYGSLLPAPCTGTGMGRLALVPAGLFSGFFKKKKKNPLMAQYEFHYYLPIALKKLSIKLAC